jgi:cell division protein FtsI (penicillin-binding protein 3)
VKKNYAVVPGVTGMSLRKAVSILNEAGLKAKMAGSGTIYKQYPKPGAQMKKGSAILVRGREPSLDKLASTN